MPRVFARADADRSVPVRSPDRWHRPPPCRAGDARRTASYPVAGDANAAHGVEAGNRDPTPAALQNDVVGLRGKKGGQQPEQQTHGVSLTANKVSLSEVKSRVVR